MNIQYAYERCGNLKKEQTNPPSQNYTNQADKLPESLKTNFERYAFKSAPVINQLKVAAALKLWNDRDYRDITFDEPMTCSGKTVFVKVLVRKADGVMVGVECASTVRLGWLRRRVAELRGCLLSDSYIIAVFPETAGEKTEKVVKLADEVWVTGKNGTVAQMMFMSVFHKG